MTNPVKMSFVASIFLVAYVHMTSMLASGHLEVCDKGPSDVVFILDASGSIYKHDFERQLNFVNDVIEEFDVGLNKMRVGAVSFSNWAFVEFKLNRYFKKTLVQDAIRHVVHSRGDTNTAAALTFMKDSMFMTQSGARYGVPHVAIVLTDGESNDPLSTAYAAEAARRMGIQIFAIGIGPVVNENELMNIASYPPDQFVFRVANYKALQSIKEAVATKTCQVTTPNPTQAPPKPLPEETIPAKAVCGASFTADMILSVSPRGSDVNTAKALSFYHKMVQGLDVGKHSVHVGMVPKDCRDTPEINLRTFDRKQEALRSLDQLSRQEQADAADIVKYMRKNSFSRKFGARAAAKKVAIMIIDKDAANTKAAQKEIKKLQAKRDVEVFVIGVGEEVTATQLQRLASYPEERHVFHVTNYDDLYSIIPEVQQAICPEDFSY